VIDLTGKAMVQFSAIVLFLVGLGLAAVWLGGVSTAALLGISQESTREIWAVVGVLASMLGFLLGVATRSRLSHAGMVSETWRSGMSIVVGESMAIIAGYVLAVVARATSSAGPGAWVFGGGLVISFWLLVLTNWIISRGDEQAVCGRMSINLVTGAAIFALVILL